MFQIYCFGVIAKKLYVVRIDLTPIRQLSDAHQLCHENTHLPSYISETVHILYTQFCAESWNTESPDEPVNFVDNPLRLYQEL